MKVQNERTGEGQTPRDPNPRTTRRLSFTEEIERLIRVTGESQATCFRIYNAEFPTFDSYQAFRQFKRRHREAFRHRPSQRDSISREVSALFENLPAIDKRGLQKSTQREVGEIDRAEHAETMRTIRQMLDGDPTFLDRLIAEYAWHLMGTSGSSRSTRDS